jgi:hypothetical protein
MRFLNNVTRISTLQPVAHWRSATSLLHGFVVRFEVAASLGTDASLTLNARELVDKEKGIGWVSSPVHLLSFED